jgi:hypothetical protein
VHAMVDYRPRPETSCARMAVSRLGHGL